MQKSVPANTMKKLSSQKIVIPQQRKVTTSMASLASSGDKYVYKERAASEKQVPVTEPAISYESISKCAYFLWATEGHQNARDKEYWFRAEEILKTGQAT